MPYCTSCGSRIPEGQGKSCSMCYGDIDHGRDGYYREWAEKQMQEQEIEEREQEEINYEDEQWNQNQDEQK